MNIILVGYRGSGKTTVGRLLAERLRLGFADADEWIVRRAGKSIADIFRDGGETEFRELETNVLKELLAGDGQVLALGGGVVIRDENRAMMTANAQNRIFYLHCDAAELHRRIVADVKTAANRPALTHLGGSEAEIAHLLTVRLPLYRQIMTAEIDVTRLLPSDAAERIIALL